MSPSTRKTVQTVLTLVVLLAALAYREGWLGGGGAGGGTGSSPPVARDDGGAPHQIPSLNDGSRGSEGYSPASAAPRDAIPGGGLAAHEGVDGGHTLDRHVGRTLEQLRQRLEREDKREVSTFLDEASADRFVGQALYDRRADIAKWLASGPSGNEAFPSRLRVPAGNVLRRGASDVVAGRSVQVVLCPSRKFREGFRIVTAYVTLP